MYISVLISLDNFSLNQLFKDQGKSTDRFDKVDTELISVLVIH